MVLTADPKKEFLDQILNKVSPRLNLISLPMQKYKWWFFMKRVLVFVNLDVDALCAWKILQVLRRMFLAFKFLKCW